MNSQLRQRGRMPAVCAVALVVALVIGCAAVPAPSSGGPGAAGGSAAASASPALARGGTMSVGYASDITSLDPAIGYDTYSWPAERLIFETLITYDEGTKLVPELAEAMPTLSADRKTFTFKIRKGVSFVKPDGSVLREMTADDVVYSLNRILNPNLKPTPSPVAATFYSAIAGAQDVIGKKTKAASGLRAVDSSTVEIEIVKPDQSFLNVLAMPFGSIVPKEFAAEDTTKFSSSPVGTGPFLFESYTKGQKATFVRNQHYWQPELPHLDKIEIRAGLDSTSQLQQVQAGTLDVMGDEIPPGSFTSIRDDPQYKDQLHSQLEVSIRFMWMDTSGGPNSPTSNKKVRQALNYAIDKENIIKVYSGRGKIANCILPPDMPGYDPSCAPYTYDPAKAKQLLSEAGYPNGFSSKFYVDTVDPDPLVAQALQQDLAQIGVKAEVVTQTFDTLLGTIVVPHKAPLGWIGWFQDFPDPSDFFDPILSCATAVQGNFNLAWYCNKDVDALLASARGEPDQQKRLEMYRQAQKRVMDDAPWVPIQHSEFFNLVSKRMTYFKLHPVWRYSLRDFAVSQ